MFTEKPRKVHLFHDQKGARIPHSNRLFANTLCKMNSNVPDSHITDDPEKVTCKICLKDARFPGGKSRSKVKQLEDMLNECAQDCNNLSDLVEAQNERIRKLEKVLQFAYDHMGLDLQSVVIHNTTETTVGDIIRAVLNDGKK